MIRQISDKTPIIRKIPLILFQIHNEFIPPRPHLVGNGHISVLKLVDNVH